MALIFVERSEKLSVKTACDVNVGQVKKRGKFKTVFFESTWRRNFGRPISAPDRETEKPRETFPVAKSKEKRLFYVNKLYELIQFAF